MEINEKFIKEYSGLIHKYNDRFLADESLSDLDVLLLSIFFSDDKNKKSGAKYEDVKSIFASFGRKYNNFKVSIHNAKKQGLIEDKDKVLFLLIKGLKRIRKLLGQVEKSSVYIIKSGQNFTAIKIFEEFLLNEIEKEEILICDSYISHLSLFPFSILQGKLKSIKILTANIFDSDKFKEYAKKMKKEMAITIETKLNKKIHDRFLICGDKCWSFGTSIKDLGNKDAIVKDISEVSNSMKDLFSERWNES